MKKNQAFAGFFVVSIIVIAMGFLLVFAYGAREGWFKGIFSITQEKLSLDQQNQMLTYTVNVYFNPTTICTGESSTGFIDSNIPNGICTVWMNNGDGYKFVSNGNLNGNGDFSESTGIINTAGVATVKAVCCDGNGNCRVSNEALLTVNVCNNPNNPPQPTPTPTPVPACSDSDGGVDYYNVGTCLSTVTMTGIQDTCFSNTVLYEYYCLADKTCGKAIYTCALGWSCVAGKCVPPPCGAINPVNGQASCDVAYCAPGWHCNFVPATLSTPARCECS